MVCEVAETFQGLLPGDFGDLRRASMDQEQINNLLEVLKTISHIFFMEIQPLSYLQLR